ncbi:MAG: ribonuclease HII, partial [Clostridia bacterium]
LSRQGKHRIKVNEKFDFADNDWFQHEGNFTSTNSLGELILVNENGKVSSQNLNLAQNHRIDATANLLVSLSENILKIRDKELSLDFGLYTEPQIFLENNKYYISVTDLQTQKVYVFDSNADLLPGFPVYGTSSIDLGNINIDNAPEFVVKGDKGEILIYSF